MGNKRNKSLRLSEKRKSVKRRMKEMRKRKMLKRSLSPSTTQNDALPSTSCQQTITVKSETTQTPIITGRRILDISHFFEQIVNFQHSGLLSCTPQELFIQKEHRMGYRSNITIACKMCDMMQVVSTTKPGITGINESIVATTISTGGGHQKLAEFTAGIDIPPISYKLYRKVEKNFQKSILEQTWESMIEAGREESLLAIENNEIDEDGKPLLTVAADASWFKRSSKTNSNIHSGVGCIVGLRTGKLLYLGVENKFCAMCNKNRELKTNKEHLCFKNWSGSSTEMESTIIAEGFNSSIDLHNCIFAKLVGDSDSSVINTICSLNPYNSRIIEKIDWSDGLHRIYCNTVEEISKILRLSTGIRKQKGGVKPNLSTNTVIEHSISSTEVQANNAVEMVNYEVEEVTIKSEVEE